jgi:hypothetical protein
VGWGESIFVLGVFYAIPSALPYKCGIVEESMEGSTDPFTIFFHAPDDVASGE